MAVKILKHKKHKIGLAALLAIIGFVLLLALFINNYWSPILAQKVKNVVLTSSDSLYSADFSSAELHILKGEIILNNITLKPDTAVFNRKKRQHLAPNNLVQLHVKKLILYHIHPFKLYFQHKLDISEIILRGPELSVSYQLNHKTDTVLKDRRTPWQKISKTLRSIHFGNIYLDDVKFKYEDYSGNKVAISELKEMYLSAHDLLIDSATQNDKTRTLFCKEIVAELNNYTGKTPSGLYSYKINHLRISTRTSQVNGEGLTLAPINAGDFFSISKKDRFTLHVDSLQLNNFDYLGYHKYRKFRVSTLHIKRGDFALFNNPNKFSDPKVDKIKSFPKVVLSELTTDLRIDTTIIRHMDVAYSEFNKQANKTGTIRFNNTSARFLNITNNKAALLKNNICTANITTYFMGKGKLDVQFVFNLTADDAAFSYKGHLGYLDLNEINPATMPLAMVKITSGSVKQFDFDIHGSSNASRGKITLLYNNLKVKILKPDTTFGLKQKLVASLYANLFIIKHDNPDNAGEAPRSFNINYVRPKDSPFFKAMWQTLLTGIKPSAGLDEKTVRATEIKMNDAALNKQKRLIKKAQRQQRRAERRQKRALKNR